MNEQAKNAVIMIASAILDAIKDSGSRGIPSGHLYVMLMGTLSLEQYQAIVDGLKDAKRIRIENHVLYAM